jgi:hypothetical protein
MSKPNRLDAIRKAASAATTPESPFKPGTPKVKAQLQGARTGWNPNPEIGEVKTTVYTNNGVPQAGPKLKTGAMPKSRWSPPMSADAPAPRRPAPRASDALLDRAAAKRAAAAPAPPSGAVTGPRLRTDRQPSGSRWSPPMDARTSSARVTVRTQRPGRPAPAPTTPAPKAPPAARPAATAARPPRLKPGVAPPMRHAVVAPRPVALPKGRVGGGRWGAAASVAVHAGTTLAHELQRKDKKK